MLIDLHAHSSAISLCCQIPAREVINVALEKGIDGIVLTNHYQKSYIEDGTASDFAERYIEEFYSAESYGRELGCKVFFGIEVSMELYTSVHMLVYGVKPDFLREYPTLFDCTQKELYALVKSAGGILIQAHPYRNGTTVLDTDFLDGVEINCHPIYGKSYSEELFEVANKHDLILTCGGDYHADTYRPKCGMYIPDDIGDTFALASYLSSDGEKTLCIQEPNTEETVVKNHLYMRHTWGHKG